MLFNLFIWFVQEGEKSRVSTEINSKKHSKSWRKDLFCDCNARDNVSQLSCPFSLRAESRTSSESQAPDGKFAGSGDMSVHQSLMQRITLDCSLQTTHIVLVRLSTALTKCPRGLSSREKMFVLAPILRGVSPQSLLDSACSGPWLQEHVVGPDFLMADSKERQIPIFRVTYHLQLLSPKVVNAVQNIVISCGLGIQHMSLWGHFTVKPHYRNMLWLYVVYMYTHMFLFFWDKVLLFNLG